MVTRCSDATIFVEPYDCKIRESYHNPTRRPAKAIILKIKRKISL